MWSEALARSELAASAIVFTEVAQLHLRRRVDLGMSPERWLQERMRDGLRVVPVTPDIAVRAPMLETTGFHGDPIDRLIASTAMQGDHTLRHRRPQDSGVGRRPHPAAYRGHPVAMNRLRL